MEITKLSESSIKIKSKTALFTIHPLAIKSHVACDAAFFLEHSFDMKALSVEGDPIIINGPGEYEIKSVKVVGRGKGEDVGYIARIEGIVTYVVKASSLLKSKDMTEDCQLLILHADVPTEENLVAASNAQVAVLYGEHASAFAKQLGKESAPVSKFVTTKDKLPAETEIVVLG